MMRVRCRALASMLFSTVFLCLGNPAFSAEREYKVVTARLFELDAALKKAARDGWMLISATTSSQCRFKNGEKFETGECQVLIFEKKQ